MKIYPILNQDLSLPSGQEHILKTEYPTTKKITKTIYNKEIIENLTYFLTKGLLKNIYYSINMNKKVDLYQKM